jgi:hypothetical protein
MESRRLEALSVTWTGGGLNELVFLHYLPILRPHLFLFGCAYCYLTLSCATCNDKRVKSNRYNVLRQAAVELV